MLESQPHLLVVPRSEAVRPEEDHAVVTLAKSLFDGWLPVRQKRMITLVDWACSSNAHNFSCPRAQATNAQPNADYNYSNGLVEVRAMLRNDKGEAANSAIPLRLRTKARKHK